MPRIEYWNDYKKKRNSTARPSSGGILDVLLKEDCDIDNPTFLLNINNLDINYIKAFNQYYYAHTRTVHNNLVELVCELDPMATFKSDIGAYTAFVERSSMYVDDMIPDPYVTMKSNEVVKGVAYGSSVSFFSSTGYFIVTVLNDLGSNGGFTCYYAIDATNLKKLAQYINQDWGSSSTSWVEWVQANFLHTSQAIIDCKWLPFTLSSITSYGAWEELKVGVDVVTGVRGYRITDIAIATDAYNIPIPHYYNDFRKAQPYSTGKIFIPMFGTMDFNPTDFDDDKIYFVYNADLITGDVIVYVRDSSSYQLATYTFNCAVSCPIGHVGQDLTGTAGSLLGTVGSVAASSGASAVVAGIAGGINTLSTSIIPMTSYRGSTGGRAFAYNGLVPKITIIARVTSDPSELLYRLGRPLMQYRQLNAFTGYVKCAGASVPIAGEPIYKELVNQYLNTGFYYE